MFHPPTLATQCRAACTTALAAALLLAAGCSGERSGPRTILITIDTLRDARVGAWGDPAARTPWLDRMARLGRQYANARCDAPHTLPSHATLFTGVPVIAHGVRLNRRTVGPAAYTLAEAMSDAGWETAAVVSTWALCAPYGLDQGFASYDDRIETPYHRYNLANFPNREVMPEVHRRADETSEVAARALDAQRAAPLFLWVHYYDPHYPYDPPPPFDAPPFGAPYNGEVAYTDHCLGRLIRRIEDTGSAARDRIAIAADHGESLGDFGEDEHGLLIYDATMRVPMVLAGRGVTAGGSVRTESVTLADLGATLAAELTQSGASHREDRTAPLGLGRDLLAPSGVLPEIPIYGESIASREEHEASGLKSLVQHGWKYVHSLRPELYDLASDPGERTNLASRHPERVAELRQRLREVVAAHHRGTWHADIEAPLVQGADEALRALGYIGGREPTAGQTSVEEEMELRGFNPRDAIRLMVAGRYLERRLWSQAERALEDFLRIDDPDSASHPGRALLAAARNDQGFLYSETGRHERALTAFAQALRLQPDHEPALRGKAAALLSLGRPGDSLAFADSVLSRRPGLVSMQAARVVALRALGRVQEAYKEKRRIDSAVERR